MWNLNEIVYVKNLTFTFEPEQLILEKTRDLLHDSSSVVN
jgi:hypothetical protein